MSAIYLEIPMSLTLISPWAITGSNAAGGETDLLQVRDHLGRLIIPSTLLKGNLLGALRAIEKVSGNNKIGGSKLSAAEASAAVFGQASRSSKNWSDANLPLRGCVTFADLVCTTELPEDESPYLSRIEIDDGTRTARGGHLLHVECPFLQGKEVEFAGKLVFQDTSNSVGVDCVEKVLRVCASHLVAIGGLKSVGFGKVGDHQIGTAKAVTASPVQISKEIKCMYEIDRPFLISAEREGSGNIRSGSDVIPGGAIKAVLARALKAQYPSEDHDNDLSITEISHVFPIAEDVNRPRYPLPLSLAIEGDYLTCYLNGNPPLTGSGAPRFRPDWKENDEDRVRTALASSENKVDRPSRFSRTRTAINGETHTALFDEAKGGALFSEDLVSPSGFKWHGTIRGPNEPFVSKIAALLSAGVPGLGSTGAIISAVAEATETKKLNFSKDQKVHLYLTTDAYLFTEDDIRAIPATSVRELYSAYFAGLGMRLDNFFAQQALLGGYIALRYPPEAGRGYSPWVVTTAGSVFSLTVEDPNKFDLGKGLLPHARSTTADWTNFPFLTENGFGAFKIDHVDHEALREGVNV